MITGDHIATASAIAKDLGIIDPENEMESRAMKGYEIDLLSEELLAEQKPFPVVFARVSPDNKLKIVKALQRKGHQVIMTGDGVNDAPAIKQANVGVAMGIAGTEITKQAADIVLANDDFTTIVAAVEQGRQVYDNIIKFVVYLLSCNAAEIFLFLVCVSVNLDLPFSIMQILWANIFADIPPALSLGLEPGEKGIMERQPRPVKQNVLTGINMLVIFLQASIMTAISFTCYYLVVFHSLFGVDTLSKRQSFTFIVLTSIQLVQSFLSRSILESSFKVGIIGNKFLIYAFFIAYALLLCGLWVPPIANWLGLTDPGATAWGVVWICVLIHVICIELLKLIIRFFYKTKSPIDEETPKIIQLGSADELAKE
jgi:P-type Ca2+ transporter type 2C